MVDEFYTRMIGETDFNHVDTESSSTVPSASVSRWFQASGQTVWLESPTNAFKSGQKTPHSGQTI